MCVFIKLYNDLDVQFIYIVYGFIYIVYAQNTHTRWQMLLLTTKKVKYETAATTTILDLTEAHRSQTDAPFHS